MHSTSVKLPTEAEVGIKIHSGIEAYVKTAISNISRYIAANRIEFFPDYTDHDVSHLQDVLDLSYSLMTDESKSLLTTNDHAALVLAIMLHDLGMHLTVEGFYTLISDPEWIFPCQALGDERWGQRWLGFLDEARRFDERQLKNLFGEGFQLVKRFPELGEPLGEFDRLLAGEFLRRNHHVLAHHIALFGLPLKNGQRMEVLPKSLNVDEALADLAGLVARSHGTSLRSMFNYLEEEYDDRISPRGTHPIYLMALLRTSDYLQIQSERAPLPRTIAVAMRSPISRREWKVHQCVKGIRNTIDPETLYIDAEPEDVESYARLRWWLDDAQNELDNTWATLGEVYGLQHHTGLKRFGLNIRRIRSNIDDREKLSRRINYLPEIIYIRANNDKLLRGLVGPLYGDYPGAGLRELIQNSADAVLEARSLSQKQELSPEQDYWDIETDIEITLDRNEIGEFSILTIRDRGVGMTIDTIKNYFLNIGASYRHSKEWKSLHSGLNSDRSRLRSGRFGVGVLAGFLIGERMSVRTRGIGQNRDSGVEFSVSIADDLVELRNVSAPVGTQIQIQISDRFREYLDSLNLHGANVFGFAPIRRSSGNLEVGQRPGSFGDYYGEYPSFSLRLDGRTLNIEKSAYLENSESDLYFSETWKRFEHADLSVMWTFTSHKPAFSVNNFVVGLNDVMLNSGERWEINCPYLESPSISVLDRYGTFPLDMRRRGLGTATLPFNRELIKSITQKFAYDSVCNILQKGMPRMGDEISEGIRNFHGWHRTSTGIVPGFPALFKAMDVKSCFAIMLDYRDSGIVSAGQDTLGVYSVHYADFNSDQQRTSARILEFFDIPDFGTFLDIEPLIVKKFAPLSLFFSETESKERIDDILSELSEIVRYCDFGRWITRNNTQVDGVALGDLAQRLDNSLAGENYYVNEIMLDFSDFELSDEERVFQESWVSIVGSIELPTNLELLRELKLKMEEKRFW